MRLKRKSGMFAKRKASQIVGRYRRAGKKHMRRQYNW